MRNTPFFRPWLKRLALMAAMAVMACGTASAAESPRVRLQTTMGDIVVELYPDKAPKTVVNFLAYVKSGFYDGTIFHRVIDGFMIQGGGFTADFAEKETRAPIENEAGNGLQNTRGTIAMARTSDPHSAAAQFFINVADNAFLNHSANTEAGWGYCVFGKVVDGMETVDKIRQVPTGNHGPFGDVPQTVVLISKAQLIATEDKKP